LTEATEITSDPRLYVQVTEDLRRKISSGDLKAVISVSIGDLWRQWGACRQTVSKALRILENDGLLRRYPGHGYYVQPRSQQPPPPR
jgi:DNA-binding GntR family transcriptional regulator